MNRNLTLTLWFILALSAIAQEDNEIPRNKKVAAIPIFNYSRTVGFSFGFMGQIFYKINKNDSISPTSYTGLIGLLTTNQTYFTGVFQNYYLKEDTWRLKIAAGYGNINFQYWQESPDMYGTFVDYNTKHSFLLLQAQRKIYNKLYAGLNFVISEAKTEYDEVSGVPEVQLVEYNIMNNIGYLINLDKREHQMNPYEGFNISIKNDFYREWLNSSYNFEKFKITYNHFYTINNTNNILATRISFNISTGNVPFEGENVVGREDIRGYSEGKYRDKQVYAIQAEYRWHFYKQFGMVGFAGLASAVNDASELFKNNILPGTGLGLRYMMIPNERINIGIDVAVGKDDWGLYFRIGEAFNH